MFSDLKLRLVILNQKFSLASSPNLNIYHYVNQVKIFAIIGAVPSLESENEFIALLAKISPHSQNLDIESPVT